MTRNRGDALFWGLLILLFGVVFLLRNMGVVDVNVWKFLGKFWPLILIYIGAKNIVVHVLSRRK